jgi:hypothetical protein
MFTVSIVQHTTAVCIQLHEVHPQNVAFDPSPKPVMDRLYINVQNVFCMIQKHRPSGLLYKEFHRDFELGAELYCNGIARVVLVKPT